MPRDLRLNALIGAVRMGKPVSDRVFDSIYPDLLRIFSWRYWTPLDVARRAAQMLVTRDIEWDQFDAFYFFNPFGEHDFDAAERLDAFVDVSPQRSASDRAFVCAALDRAPLGTRVATYYGLGCRFPSSFERVKREPAGSDVLELWIKVRG